MKADMRESAVFNLPNAITLLRIALTPLLARLLLQGAYQVALCLFIVSALSDLLDGWIARHWNLRTRFGAIADPLADKLTMLTVTLLLAWQDWLPWWFALAVILRDVVIVSGAITYHWLIGPVEMAPSRLSKLNTALEFLLLASVMGMGAGSVTGGPWSQLLLIMTLVTIVLSGVDYASVWSRKALLARRTSK